MSLVHEFFLGFNSGFAIVACILVYALAYYSNYIWLSETNEDNDLDKPVSCLKGADGKQNIIDGLEFVCIGILEDENPQRHDGISI